MKNYTDITILMDSSGSMAKIKKQMESALVEFVDAHRQVPSTRLSFITFGGDKRHIVQIEDTPISEVRPEALFIYPYGSTPLNDAICVAIDNLGFRLKRKLETERPDQVLFVIVTDGEENSSMRYTTKDVKERIERQQKSYNWQFTFLGTNQDAITTAQDLGILREQAINFAYSPAGASAVMDSLISNSLEYTKSSERSRGLASYTDKQRNLAITND